MVLRFSLDETGFQVNVDFPAWVEKIHDYVWDGVEDDGPKRNERVSRIEGEEE